jgi:hypothetical protein
MVFRRPSRVVLATAVLAATIIGYLTYAQRPFVDAPQPAAARIETSGSVGPVVNPQPVEAPEVETAAAPVTRPPATSAGRAGERKPPRAEACTEAVAALGLCSTKGEAAAGPAITPPPKTDLGKADGQAPPDPQACTDAVAALGLCARKSIQRGE